MQSLGSEVVSPDRLQRRTGDSGLDLGNHRGGGLRVCVVSWQFVGALGHGLGGICNRMGAMGRSSLQHHWTHFMVHSHGAGMVSLVAFSLIHP